MSEPTADRASLLAWMDVLDRIEASLNQSFELANDPPPVVPVARDGPPAALERLDRRLALSQQCLDQAERNAKAAEDLLCAEQSAFEQIRQRIGQVQNQLAAWATKVG